MPNKKYKGFRRRASEQPVDKHPKRSCRRKLWSDDQMKAAIEAVISGGLSQNQAAESHGVPRSTLKDRLSGRVVHGVNPGLKPYLTRNEEKELADHLLKAAEMGYGKTRRDVCCLVETYLKEKGMLKGSSVSRGWWEKFMKRNPLLRLRVGDSTSGVRMDDVNKDNMKKYFDLLKETLVKYGFDKHPETIYNIDETGVPLCPRPPKVMAKKGQKKIRYRTSGTKSQVTVIGCGNAAGQIIPPFIIYAGKQIGPLWTVNEVNGFRFAVSENGWIDKELFKAAVAHFPH